MFSPNVDFAEAVQLIAEEVGHEEGPGLRFRGNLGQRALVHLDHQHAVREPASQVRVAYGEARDALHEVGAGRVVADGYAFAAEQGRGEARGRRLAVAAGDGHDGHAGNPDKLVEDARIHLPGDHAGDRGSAAATNQAGGTGGGLAGGQGEDRSERRGVPRANGTPADLAGHARRV